MKKVLFAVGVPVCILLIVIMVFRNLAYNESGHSYDLITVLNNLSRIEFSFDDVLVQVARTSSSFSSVSTASTFWESVSYALQGIYNAILLPIALVKDLLDIIVDAVTVFTSFFGISIG